MPKLQELIPDGKTLVALAPEELAYPLLQAMVQSSQNNGQFHQSHIVNHEYLFGHFRGNPSGQKYYADADADAVRKAIGEAWQWLEINGLIMNQPGDSHGWMILTRRGEDTLKHPENFSAYAAASKFPKDLIHPAFRESVWLELARGDYDAAVFKAFRAVEIAARNAGGYGDEAIGVTLMTNAFSPKKGPLAKTSDHPGEQRGLMELFTGAMGTFKNPQSHRTVGLNDPQAAQQMVAFASWLMSVIDSRKP